MSQLTSFQRKLIYTTGILLLLIPVTALGLPAEPAADGRIETGTGGWLAQQRARHELGESSLGNVDPASSTMNLLLLGFRGIATSVLWVEAQEQQKQKDWASLDATVKSIVLLQPHFLKVWHFQGWNLAYNVSAEWDAVADRYYWVKRGIKFYTEGKNRNEKFGELYWYVGDTTGKKIGRSDEWAEFRKFFLQDPDTERFPSGLDPEVNPNGEDNYLRARYWFQEANAVCDRYGHEQHVMWRALFRSYPVRSLIDFAMTQQREGKFDETTRAAWDNAFIEWTEKYGREEIPAPIGAVRLELTEEEIEQFREQDAQKTTDFEKVLHWVDRYQDTTNYRYWRTRCKVEGERDMAEAHRELYEGENAYRAGDYDTAIELFDSGMAKFEAMLKKYSDLESDDNMIEEGMVALWFWRDCHTIVNGPDYVDELEDYPLKEMWEKHQNRLSQIEDEIRRRKRFGR